jgi:hypothetical protein
MAEAAANTNLAPGWKAIADAEGDYYFWNAETAQVSFHVPGHLLQHQRRALKVGHYELFRAGCCHPSSDLCPLLALPQTSWEKPLAAPVPPGPPPNKPARPAKPPRPQAAAEPAPVLSSDVGSTMRAMQAEQEIKAQRQRQEELREAQLRSERKVVRKDPCSNRKRLVFKHAIM